MIDSQAVRAFWRSKIETDPMFQNSISHQTLEMTEFVINHCKNGIAQYRLYEEVEK